MKNFKTLSDLIDKYYKSYDENGNEIDGNACDYAKDIENELNYLFNWDGKLEDIDNDIKQLRKELKTHTHKEGTVYIKL